LVINRLISELQTNLIQQQMFGMLAVLSISAAAGMRLALPLLIIGLLQNDLWEKVPLLNYINPQILVGILAAWSFLEVFIAKKTVGKRIIQVIELIFSPLVGAVMAMTVAKITGMDISSIWITGVVGGLFALVIQFVKVGWFFRLGKIPVWVMFAEDILCVCLVLFSLRLPRFGGILALLILWFAIRTSQSWYQWKNS
jgi:hypothetical protein